MTQQLHEINRDTSQLSWSFGSELSITLFPVGSPIDKLGFQHGYQWRCGQHITCSGCSLLLFFMGTQSVLGGFINYLINAAEVRLEFDDFVLGVWDGMWLWVIRTL